MSANQNNVATAVEEPAKFVNLVSNDDIVVNINIKAARKSTVIANLLDCFPAESDDAEMKIPLPNVNGEMLQKIVRYLEHYMNDPDRSENIDTEFDNDFVPTQGGDLVPLILASNYLDVRNLTDLCARTWAETLKGKTTVEMRHLIGVENDFTEAEQREIAENYEWTKK